MQHVVKYSYILFTFLLFIGTPAWAAIDLGCPVAEQNNSIADGRWNCPTLGNGANLDATLSDLDVETGQYTCEYRYPDTQQIATACTYLSRWYKEDLDEELSSIQRDLIGIITKGTPSFKSFMSPFPQVEVANTLKNFYNNTIGTKHLNSFSKDKNYIYERTLITSLHDDIRDALKNNTSDPTKPDDLNEFFNIGAGTAKGYLYDYALSSNDNPMKKLKESYNTLVRPYTPYKPTGAERKEDTFSRFVTGLVTLDKNIVQGYNEKNGTLVLKKDWKKKTAPDLFKVLIEAFSKENNNSKSINTERNNINSWVNIFEQKIWGFYYNLQRRLDLGYDIIATELLFIMMVFFSIGMSVRGGARYITNRENGHSSGEVKINEASIMKTLGILAVVFSFYISVPYKSESTYATVGGTDINHFGGNDIRTNASFSKLLIRYAMEKGAYFGTMVSDLGTDAFLRHIVHKQGLNNGLKESENVIRSIMSMAYYFPAYEIVNECRFQTGLSDDRLLSGQGSKAISTDFSEAITPGVNTDPKIIEKYKFYIENDIKMISDALCSKMISQTAHKLEEVSDDMNNLLAMIKKDIFLRQKATSALVGNHITLQKELGWMNIASIPYTYFMMKHQHLFYETSMDYKAIKEKSRKYANNIGLRGGQESIDSTLWHKNKAETQKRLDTAKSKEGHVKEYTRLAVYNFLPGFSSIRNEVLQRIQSLFSDILRMQQRDDKSNKHLPIFAELLGEMTATAGDYYGQIANLYNITKLRKEIKKAAGTRAGTGDPIELHQLFVKISYLVAMGIWKSGFVLVFLSAIAMIIGLKIVLYVINVMVHFFISPFIVLWAFATSPDGGAAKIKSYLRDTLIYMMYPTIIVIGVFMFIFAYELFYNIYGFITSMLIEGQTKAVENALIAVNQSTTYKPTDGEMSFLAIYALRDITEILIDLLSVYVAFLTINKFPELVLKMMGVGDSAVIMLPQASEAIQSKGGGSVSPLSR